MSDQQSSFAPYARTYRPWGQVRRKNLIARIAYGLTMTVLGLGALAAVVLLFIFAASVAVVGVVALALVTLGAFLRRSTPAKIFVHAKRDGIRRETNGKGVYEARKKGSTWIVY